MMSDRPVWRAALGGAILGAAGGVVIQAARGRYTFPNDLFLPALLAFALGSAYAAAAAYGVSLFRIASVGTAALAAGAWLGSQLIGSYEYTVPTPTEHRELRIVERGGERVVPIPGAPAETVRRFPVGAAIGAVCGWAVGVYLCVRAFRPAPPRADAAG